MMREHLHGQTIAVTGAGGFIGRHLIDLVNTSTDSTIKACHRVAPQEPQPWETFSTGDLTGAEWDRFLGGTDILFHLAGAAHSRRLTDEEVRRVNVEGTRIIVEAAIKAGVKKIVYLSSVKAAGEMSGDHCLNESDIESPEDIYGLTKLEAERQLFSICSGERCSVSVIRSPLVYGPGVKANFFRLLSLVDSGLPLPLKSVSNTRSLVYVGNLTSALSEVSRPDLSGVFYVRDGRDVSTPELVGLLADELGATARLFSVPPRLLRLIGAMAGKENVVDRLLGTLCVEDVKLRQQAGWTAPYTLEEGIGRTVQWYRNRSI